MVECLELGLHKGQELPNVIVFGYEVVDNSAGTLANPKFNSWRTGTVREYLMAATTSRVGFDYLWNKFIQRQFIIMSNIHFEKFNYDEDAIFLSQLYLKVQSISFSDDILYQYVQYPNSLTHAKKNYYESVRSLSRLNQVTDELSQEYALFENGLQLRIKLRLVFALVRKKRDLSSDELSIIRALLKSIKSIHQYISIKDQIAALCITVLGVPGVRIIQFFL